jgi:hypothetical protein
MMRRASFSIEQFFDEDGFQSCLDEQEGIGGDENVIRNVVENEVELNSNAFHHSPFFARANSMRTARRRLAFTTFSAVSASRTPWRLWTRTAWTPALMGALVPRLGILKSFLLEEAMGGTPFGGGDEGDEERERTGEGKL